MTDVERLPAIDWDGQGWEGAGEERFVSDTNCAGAGGPVFVAKDSELAVLGSIGYFAAWSSSSSFSSRW